MDSREGRFTRLAKPSSITTSTILFIVQVTALLDLLKDHLHLWSVPGLVLFACAWDSGWWQAWVSSVLVVAAGIGGRVWAEQLHPGLLAERQNFEKAPGVKAWDKVLAPLLAVSVSFPLVIVAGLDHRFKWSPAFPIWLNILGFALIAMGYTFAG